MRRDLTIREYTEWRIYYGYEPFGPQVDDLQSAHTRLTIAQTSGAKKKGNQSFELSDFRLLSDDRKGKQQQSMEEMKQTLLSAFGLSGSDG